jgi:hypothetical protein
LEQKLRLHSGAGAVFDYDGRAATELAKVTCAGVQDARLHAGWVVLLETRDLLEEIRPSAVVEPAAREGFLRAS